MHSRCGKRLVDWCDRSLPGNQQSSPVYKIPNLFIIGAMKAGTSSLHEYLHQHPDIFMSRMKEPQYFAPHVTRQGLRWGQGCPHPQPGMDWYLRLFDDAGDAKYAGESSVSYTAIPWVTGCAERLFAFNSQAKFIYLLRDPIERALSHYWHFVADGREDRDPLTAIQRKEEYVSRSDYLRQIEPYWSQFGRDAVYVLTLEDLMDSPKETLSELFAWLGVDPHVPIDTQTRFNVGTTELWQTRRGLVPVDTWRKHWRVRAVAERCPKVLRRLLQRLVYRRVNRSDVDVEPAIDHLRSVLQPKTRRFEQAVGRDFPQWRWLWNESRETSQAGHRTLLAPELAPQ
jgi:hypothetical protein